MSTDASEFRTTTVSLCGAGIGVMILGLRLIYDYDPDNTVTAIGTPIPPGDALLFLPVILGALLTFVGGVRLSLLLRPRNMLFLGVAMLSAAILGPPAVSAHIPAMNGFPWRGAVLVPLFITRILGVIFFATAIVRWRSDGHGHAPDNRNSLKSNSDRP